MLLTSLGYAGTCAVIFSVFFLAGLPWLLNAKAKAENSKQDTLGLIPLSILLGGAILFVCLDFSIRFFDNLIVGIATFAFLTTCAWVRPVLQKRGVQSEIPKFSDVVTKKGILRLISALTISFLTLLPFLTSDGFALRQRVGPDGIGWASSALYFSNNNTLLPLKQELERAIHPLTIENVFDVSRYEHGKSPIYDIPNYSVQINSEFLLGANRISGPAFMGLIMRFFGFSSFEIIPFMFLLFFALTLLLLLDLYRLLVPKSILILSIFAIIFSTPVQTVALEGGIGNLLCLPYFIASIVFVLNSLQPSKSVELTKMFRKISLPFLAASLALYFDSIFGFLILAPLCLLGFWSNRKLLSNKWNLLDLRQTLVPIGILMLFAPIWYQIPSFLIFREGNRSDGGWSVGNWPVFTDFVGLTNWIASTGINAKPQLRFSFLLLDIFVLILIFGSMWKKRNTWSVARSILVIYVVSVALSVNLFLFLTSQELKTYQIWKASFFLAPLFILSISYAFSNFNYQRKQRAVSPSWLLVLLSSTCIAGLTSTLDFRSGSATLPLDLRESGQVNTLKKFWDFYDVRPVGFKAPQLLALVSDDFFFSARSDSPKYSEEPRRNVLWVVNRSSCSTSRCESESEGLRLIREYESFLLFVKQE